MKCLVCGKEFEAAECPRCHFPDVQIIGDREKALENMMPTIIQYRTNFMSAVKLFLEIYRWKDQNGQLVLERKEHRLLGTAQRLMREQVWLEDKFARIADQKTITVTIRMDLGGDEKQVAVSIPNLHKAELQQLGATVDSDYNLRLMLRNDTEQPTMSGPVAVFA